MSIMADEVMLPNGKVDYNVCKYCGMARKPCATGWGVFITNEWWDIVHDDIVVGEIYNWYKPGYTNVITIFSSYSGKDLDLKVPLDVFHIQSMDTEMHARPWFNDPFILKSEYDDKDRARYKAISDAGFEVITG
jgi:hypothetical protein